MILPFQDLKKRIESSDLITDYASLDEQLQSAGFDVRLGKVYEVVIHSGKAWGSLNARGEKTLPETKLLASSQGEEVFFQKGASYLLETTERFNLPLDVNAKIQPRLTTALIGLNLQTAEIDAGYKGGLRFSGFCSNPCKIEVGARFAQVIFQKLLEPTEKPYKGFYQNRTGLGN